MPPKASTATAIMRAQVASSPTSPGTKRAGEAFGGDGLHRRAALGSSSQSTPTTFAPSRASRHAAPAPHAARAAGDEHRLSGEAAGGEVVVGQLRDVAASGDRPGRPGPRARRRGRCRARSRRPAPGRPPATTPATAAAAAPPMPLQDVTSAHRQFSCVRMSIGRRPWC